MVPNVTLHWWTHPQWFEELGEFTAEDSIPLFVDWAQMAFQNFDKFWPVLFEGPCFAICYTCRQCVVRKSDLANSSAL